MNLSERVQSDRFLGTLNCQFWMITNAVYLQWDCDPRLRKGILFKRLQKTLGIFLDNFWEKFLENSFREFLENSSENLKKTFRK